MRMMPEDYTKMWKDMGLDVDLHRRLVDSVGRQFGETVMTQKNRPAGMGYFDHVIHAAHGERVRELIDAKERGLKIAGTFCIYVPEEIAMALDVIPVPLCGGTNFSIPYAEKTFPRDICPLVKSTLGMAFSKTCPYAPIKNIAVGETTCDAKKKTWDILAGKVHFHVMEVPQKKEDPDRAVWLAEVKRFTEEMKSLSGRKLEKSRLEEAVRVMNGKRSALQAFSELRGADRPPVSGLDALVVYQCMLMDEPVRFTEKLMSLNEELSIRVQEGVSPFPPDVRRILVSGCPSVSGNWKLHHLIESSGAAVVADETCTGSRYFADLVENSRDGVEGMLERIADRYMKINCSCFTPNEGRIDDVRRMAATFRVHGVVQYILQYCHTYNIEAVRVASALKKAGIPQIAVETDYSSEDTGQLATRIEAFLEQIGQQ
jgi:benzoyl-CoA reductase/2-hydroxyglutaryl-CoA dehydratase subunit BcrC/BadD/HgdB